MTTTPADRHQADHLIAAVEEALRPPTSYRDDSPIPSIGNAPPIWQDDKRIVPAWAVGIAVASIGVGAGVTGIGCGAWLILQGLASVTLNGVLMVTLPFAGLAMVITAIGGAINKARDVNTTHHHHYNGPVRQEHRTTNTRAVWAKTINSSGDGN